MDVNKLVEYEDGQLSFPETVQLFSELVSTGLAWQLQGSYGRMAQSLIDSGVLRPDGRIIEGRS